jgi:hypothetical protein
MFFIHGISDLSGAEHELLLIVERFEVRGYSPSVVLLCIGGVSMLKCATGEYRLSRV